jgi:hypothetical protein
MSSEERRSVSNGIWMCENHGKLVDSDESRYTVAALLRMKADAETDALHALEQRHQVTSDSHADLRKATTLAPNLVAAMQRDLFEDPLFREFVLLGKNWVYNSHGTYYPYFYEDHQDLDQQVRLLANLGLIREITFNNTRRFTLSERLADYLLAAPVLPSPGVRGNSAPSRDATRGPECNVDVEAYGGRRATVTVRNRGDAFTLLLHGRLASSTAPIDHPQPYVYLPRHIGTGSVFENYQIASVDERRCVAVFGEVMEVLQIWQPEWGKRLEFTISLSFVSKEGEHAREIEARTLTVSLEPRETRLIVGLV